MQLLLDTHCSELGFSVYVPVNSDGRLSLGAVSVMSRDRQSSSQVPDLEACVSDETRSAPQAARIVS